MLFGVVVVLMAELLGSHLALTVVGLALLVLGLALFIAAWMLARSMSVEVVLDDDGYRVSGAGIAESGGWADVTKVTRGAGRISFHRADDSRVQLVLSRAAHADLDSLGEDIARHLDANRGYR